MALAVNLTVAQADGFDPAVFIACPGGHGVGIGVIKHNCPRLRHFPDILTEIQHFSDNALSVHDAAGAEGIAHTLIHTVFQRNVHIHFKSGQAPDADAVDNISGAAEGFPSVCCGLNGNRDIVAVQIPLAQTGYLIQIVRIDIRKGHLNVMKFRYGHDIRK